MNGRYDINNIITTNKENKRVFKSIIYPTIIQKDSDMLIITTEMETLDNLAYKYYGDSTLWWIIAQANHIKGVRFIPRDIQIFIPMDISQILYDHKTLNES